MKMYPRTNLPLFVAKQQARRWTVWPAYCCISVGYKNELFDIAIYRTDEFFDMSMLYIELLSSSYYKSFIIKREARSKVDCLDYNISSVIEIFRYRHINAPTHITKRSSSPSMTHQNELSKLLIITITVIVSNFDISKCPMGYDDARSHSSLVIN